MLEIKLNKGTILVDNEDWEYLKEMSWYISNQGYAMTGIWMKFSKTTRQFKMEHFIIATPKNHIVDHINGNRSDNRKENLRIVTKSQNNINKKKRSNSKSKFKGIVWLKNENRWKATIKKNGKEYYIGRFINEIDAARAYDKKAIEVHGEYARLNFPEFNYCDYKIERTTYSNQKPKNIYDPPK